METLKRWWKALVEWLHTNFSYRQKIALIILCGVVVGSGLLFAYLLRMHTYLGDDPSACVNCHIMTPYYATWSHSSHARNATCNDCHVPHSSVVAKYGFKAFDGLKHTTWFMMRSERQAIMAEEPSAKVIMNNCIRCHTELNQELVKTGRIGYMQAKVGEGKACWDCHRQVPHRGMNNLAATPGAHFVAPLPPSPVPEWLQKCFDK
ncbi:MAG: cytochrome c nitrite reductase small subunit [Paludibacteraceae bacterium]|nr:cytochrome c nitrite reductase small subunit [Paludibacteraceae bacterium]